LSVITALEDVVSEIRIVNEGWTATAANAADELAARVDEVNGLLRQVAELNRAVLESTTQTGSPNDLLDRRDVVLDRLSELAGVTVTPEKHSTVRVSLNGMQLVGGDRVSILSVDPATAVITHDSGVEINASGVLGGFQTVITKDLPAFQAQLDSFVEELAAALNSRHAAGFHENGAGGDLLSFVAGEAARTLAVAVSDPADLAGAGVSGPPFPAFDAANAEFLAALQFDEVAVGGTATLDELHRTLVVEVGGATAASNAAAASQAAVQGSADLARLGQHGVSIDEEMVELLHYQRAYEAAARVMTAVDEALDTLINRTGIVGR
jgi:flagellar hook-associated protein 1 FlgK